MLTKKLQEAAGNAAEPLFVESVFSTYLYTGNSSTQTITNGIDLDGEGGMVWIKQRSNTAISGGLPSQHLLFDTQRGANNMLASNSTYQNLALSGYSFNSNGFSVSQYTNIDPSGNPYEGNYSPATYASWTFRKAPKFFDVVTYTGDGSASKSIAHNLGAVPGCIIVKATSTTGAWAVWHRSGTQNNQYAAFLEQTGAYGDTGANIWGTGGPSVTSSSFTVGTNGTVNASGATYVAYLFAHDAGGFGASGTDNVISCGSFTTDGSGNATVTLGYEPQYLLFKRSDSTGNWFLLDTMRGFTASASNRNLYPNLSDAEAAGGAFYLTATGFGATSTAASATFIYIAIRRGPMKTPESGTSVFTPVAMTGTGGARSITSGFPVDAIWNKTRGTSGLVSYTWGFVDRLRGRAGIDSTQTGSEQVWTNSTYDVTEMGNTTVSYGIPSATNINYSSDTQINWLFRRAPGFFDVVCYTGTGSARTVAHNLGVVPELMIVKNRTTAGTNWPVYHSFFADTDYIILNSTAGSTTSSRFNNTDPTSTVFSVGAATDVNGSGNSLVAYLFASCPGVSKVGSYTGTGTTQQINCGFSAGARFVLIKRADSTGDWYVWDSARGIVAGNDPYLLLNSTAAEVTSTDYIDPYSAGFEISSTAPAAINASGGSFIFFAVS